jgi:cardiolipin synthase
MREALPLWILIALMSRDLLLAILTLVLTRKGQPPLEVTYIGKAATFNLLYAFPFLLLALSDGAIGTLAFIFGWAFALWGVALYLFTGAAYFRIGVNRIRVAHH